MQPLLYTFLLLVSYSGLSCQGSVLSSRILNGARAEQGQFPFNVAINIFTSTGMCFCGGTLINTNWVLTAAHCAKSSYTKFKLFFGSTSSTSGRESRTTTNRTVHPLYDSSRALNDVALIYFDKAVTYGDTIQPAKLTSNDTYVDAGENALITGWGYSQEGGSVSSKLLFGLLETISNTNCKQTFGSKIVSSTLCAKKTFREHAVCLGDSGSPMIIYESGDPVVVGVASFIAGSGCEKGIAGFARLQYYVDWIKEVTGLDS